MLARQLLQRRRVDAQIRRGVRERQAFGNRRVRVNHTRRDRRVVAVESALEILGGCVGLSDIGIAFGAATPEQHGAIERLLAAEAANVGAHLFREIALTGSALHVRTAQALHVRAIEHRRPRRERLQLRPQPFEQCGFEHGGLTRGFVSVVGIRVPRAEHEVVERRERHEVSDARYATVRARAESDRPHLRQRAHRLRESFADGVHARDQRRADRAEPDEQHAEPARRRRDVSGRMSHVSDLRAARRAPSRATTP